MSYVPETVLARSGIKGLMLSMRAYFTWRAWRRSESFRNELTVEGLRESIVEMYERMSFDDRLRLSSNVHSSYRTSKENLARLRRERSSAGMFDPENEAILARG